MHYNVAVLVSGRGSNLEAILRAVEKGRINNARVTVVVSNKKGVRALEVARRYGVPTEVVESSGFKGSREEYDRLVTRALERHGITDSEGIVVLAGFMRILSPEFVARYRDRIINIHPSLMPAFPGMDAQKQALEYGAKVAGCTVHFVVNELDAGPVILQRAVPVMEGDDVDSLSARILVQEHRILPEAIRLLAEGKVRVEGRRVEIST